jgi:hypothetical protein
MAQQGERFMAAEKAPSATKGRSLPRKVKLALGAAGLFLFIVGVKRSFRLDESREVPDGPSARDTPPST